jgi:site-specific DNA recombinase
MDDKYRYCLYARKSSESDERQALSIDSQVDEMLEQAKRDKIKVIEIRRESHSAKDSGERPVYNEIIKDIRKGKFDAVLTWAADRLSRNAGDLGSLVDLMDQGLLKEIRTHGQTFSNSPNEKFLLMILGSQAKLENDNRSVNVKRGMRRKASMGWRPGVPPLGYMSDRNGLKGEKRVFLDPARAPMIREMFERVGSGESGRMIFRWFNTEGFTTRSGKKVTLSTIYLMLRNPYYSGKFEYPVGSGTWYDVGHESIVPQEVFDEVQIQLTVAPKSRPGTKEFEFTRILKCGTCGSGVTAEEKFKRLKNGKVLRYVYYHCTRSRNLSCKEPYIREEDLLDQLITIVKEVPIRSVYAKEKLQREVARYRNLTETILKRKSPESKLPKVDFRDYARYVLREGTKEEKREILSCLKTTLTLQNQTVSIT